MLSKLPPWARAAVITSGQAFVATLLVSLLGLIADVQEWSSTGIAPDWSVYTKGLTAALVALATGLVTAVYRAIKPPAATYPDAELPINNGGN